MEALVRQHLASPRTVGERWHGISRDGEGKKSSAFFALVRQHHKPSP